MKKKLLYILLPFIVILSSCTLSLGGKKVDNVGVDKIYSDETLIVEVQTQINKLYQEVEPMCVGIESKTKNSVGVGSGIIIEMYDKYTKKEPTDETKEIIIKVVTNYHVIDGGTSISIFIDENKPVVATIIDGNEELDVAFLECELPYIKGEVKAYDLNQDVAVPSVAAMALAVGCPLSLSNFNYPTLGLISKVTETEIVHSAPINPGNSGGPLFDLGGHLMGINVSKIVYVNQKGEDGRIEQIPVTSIGYCIPIWVIMDLAQNLGV